ncbi:MAG: histidine--tRNA ligase [Anaerolineaceae bacterium]|nr:histidine--tRNA ligase [Anaerolineaceae bacterium]
MREIIQRVKGTREFYPEDMAFRTWLYSQMRAVSESFAYQEYDGPFLEKLDLYAAKSGEELVKEQSFVFMDRGGSEVALRPELTPSLARMVAQRQNLLSYPLRMWSFGPFWRYEQPQKGRTREFFQWNIDLIGVKSHMADAELLAVCASFFKKVGLTPEHVRINVNNRRLMDSALAKIGIEGEEKALAFRMIDRRDKMRRDAWYEYGIEGGMTVEKIDALVALLENKDLWQESDELKDIFTLLEKMGLSDYFAYDPEVIRGLLYYTGTVFEARDLAKDGRAILGGGRYENLVGEVGGDPLPGVGFAMGDVMIRVVLEKYGLYPELKVQPADVMVTCFDAAGLPDAYAIAMELRGAGLNVSCYPEAVKLDKQIKYANKIGVKALVIAGPDELAAGKVTVKDLVHRSQQTVGRSDAAAALKKIFS